MAHGLDLKHEAVKDLKIDWKEVTSPKDYVGKKCRNHPEPVGVKMKAVAIHSKPSKQGDYPGVVVINFGDFDDVPGLEIISDGVSTTTLGSIAIGRQGRFMLWGFTADPDGFTETGKQLFINCVRYLYGKREGKTVFFNSHTRHYLKFRCDSVLEAIQTNRRPDETKKAFEGLLKQSSRTEVMKLKAADYGKWLDENFAYIIGDPSASSRHKEVYDVDQDAKSLKTPNNKIESLETWIKVVSEGGKDKDKAKKCLDRYVDKAIQPSGGNWKDWLEKNKSKIVFCDSVGFKFIQNPSTE